MAPTSDSVTLETLAAIVAQQHERLDALERHNAELTQENADLRAAFASPTTPAAVEVVRPPAAILERLSRRWVLHRGLQAAAASAVLYAAGHPQQEAAAAPLTDDWHLGGNTGVSTNGSNFIGTNNVAPLIFKTAPTAGSPTERMRITPTGRVGIGIKSPTAKLDVHATGTAISGRHTATSGTEPGVSGETLSTDANASGVQGVVSPTTSGVDAAGVLGQNLGTNGNGAGVRGTHAGSGNGVEGTSVSGYGVSAVSGFIGGNFTGTRYGAEIYGTGDTSTGVYTAGTTYGMQAYGAFGVYGQGTTTGIYGSGPTGVRGTSSDGIGVHGTSSGNIGVHGDNPTTRGYAIYGTGGQYAIRGDGGSTAGVRGDSGYIGVWAEAPSYGMFVKATATSGQTFGIYARSYSPSGYAGYFIGNVHVTGTLSKAAGSFRIDHPLDPENRYLSHSFVESPDMLNVYNGNVTTDANGEATITLPDYFEALNRDFRYQLTAIGDAGPDLYIADEISDNHFRIAGGKPGMQVSWLVTGIRQDAYAQAHPIQVEEDKPADERGRFLHPEALGMPAERGLLVDQQPQAQPNTTPEPDVTAPTTVPGSANDD